MTIEKINNKISFIFFCFSIALLIMHYSGLISSNFLTTYMALILIITIGVSHGALDDIKGYKLLKYYKIKNKFIFFLSYVFLALIIVTLWIFFSTLMLILFLVVASYHFGKEDCWGSEINKSNLNIIKFFLKGSLIIFAPLCMSFNETINIFNILGVENEIFYNFLNIANENYLFITFLIISILSNFLIVKKIKKSINLFVDVIAIINLYALFSPLVAFTIYFCFLHSIRHSASLTFELDIGIKELIKKTFRLTALTALLFWMSLTFLVDYQKVDIDSSIITVIFIGLASLTFPHILLEYLLEKYEKRT
jgi:beta-carotene 15,15'-dioxygenase